MKHEWEDSGVLFTGVESGGCRPWAVRDRLLFYLGNTGLDEITGLEITVECLRRIGPEPDHARAMDALAEVLRERGLPIGAVPGQTIRSFPRHNRRSMVSKAPVGRSFVGGCGRRLLGLFRSRLAADAGRPE
ncbi:MAG: hypothetical protein LUG50_12545 [Planctomycetaceae bacterium]|nr:hypothetical protein [Planctomycetaceae bacterium]